jgi:pyrroline-5-carboxylate reductase
LVVNLARTIGFLGAGNMAEAIIRGLLEGTGAAPDRIWASVPKQERADMLGQRYGIRVTTDNTELVANVQILVLAVKPQIMDRVLLEVGKKVAKDALVISIAAGISTEAIETRLSPGTHVIRAMPNTPALVRSGATALSPGAHATDEDLAAARFIFDAVGISLVLDESQLDAVTGLSGSGPAYVFLILEAFADAGVKVGLSRRDAQQLAAQTMMGASKMLLETNEHPGRLKDMVTSPGGTAIVGLHTLEQGGLRTTLINAVESATRRAQELGAQKRR